MLLFHCIIYIFIPLTDVDVTEGKRAATGMLINWVRKDVD